MDAPRPKEGTSLYQVYHLELRYVLKNSSRSQHTPTFPLKSLGTKIWLLPSSHQAILKDSNDGKGCSQFEGRRSFPSLRRLDTQQIRFLYLESKRYILTVAQVQRCANGATHYLHTCLHKASHRHYHTIFINLVL